MKCIAIKLLFIGACYAAPHGYDLNAPVGSRLSAVGGVSTSESPTLGSGEESFTNSGTSSKNASDCNAGEVLHVDGSCVVPIVTRTMFLYDAPKQPEQTGGVPLDIPPPKINHNIVFVRLPKEGSRVDPVIVPPPRQESVIYVLKKNDGAGVQRVIELPAPPPSNPEVYFVNYSEGENPTLPIGVDLQTALNAALEEGGQSIGDESQSGSGIIDREDNGTGGSGIIFGGNGGQRGNEVIPRDVIGNSGSIVEGSGVTSGNEDVRTKSPSGVYNSPSNNLVTPSNMY